jgi:hypothetical protein
MEPLKVSLNRARETKNTVRYEEPESGEPQIIGTLYIQKGGLRTASRSFPRIAPSPPFSIKQEQTRFAAVGKNH